MMDKIARSLEFLIKLPLSILIVLNVVLAILLFSTDNIAKALSIDAFVEKYRVYLGPLFILIFALLIVKIIAVIIEERNKKMDTKQRREFLHSLTPEEKGHLSAFIHENKNTINCAFGDGIAGGLHAKEIIYEATNLFNILEGTPYNLKPWARDYLVKNPQLLDGAVGRPLTNEEKIFGNRRGH